MIYDWHTLLGVGATVLNILLLVPYIRSIVRSTTKPSAVSWFGWTLLSVIAAAAQASKGVDWSLTIPVLGAVSQGTIAITALRMGRLVSTPTDRACIALAVIAAGLWFVTREPLYALVFIIIADVFVTFPTILKTYREPTSEPRTLWGLYTLACILTIAATREMTIYNLLYPLYTLLVVAIISIFARGKS